MTVHSKSTVKPKVNVLYVCGLMAKCLWITEEGLTAMIKPFRENTKSAARDNRQAQQLLGYLLPKEQEETDVRHDEEHGQLHQWMRNHAYTMEPYEKVDQWSCFSQLVLQGLNWTISRILRECHDIYSSHKCT